ncbi:MAG: transposase, partial [Thiohalorhabdaceae bacterium]
MQKGGPPGKPVVRYHYAPSRGHEVPKHLLAGFSGYLQTDGYGAYGTALADRDDVVAVGCWAHARRKFDEAVKAQGRKKPKKQGRAREGLDFIQRLYAIERQARDEALEPAARYRLRQEQAKPIIDAISENDLDVEDAVDMLEAAGDDDADTGASQMADTDAVVRRLERNSDVRYWGLVPNLTGLERALDVGCFNVATFLAASETHNQKN